MRADAYAVENPPMTLTLPSAFCIRGVKWSMENSIFAFLTIASQMQIENAISCLWLAESTEVKLQIHKLTVLTEKIHA